MVKHFILFFSILTYFLLGLRSNTNAQTVYVSGLRACVGDTVTVPFGVLNGQGLAAISLNLQIPSSGLQYLGTDSLHADLSSALFSVNSANLWAFAWYSLNPVNLNGPMGLLRFRVLAPITDTLRWDPSNSELADYTATPITSTIYQDGGFFAGTPSSVTSLSATICQGLQYLVGNQSFGTTGLYNVRLTNVEGCDSLVQLNLTVSPADTTRILRVLCSGESTNILGASYSSPTVVYQNVPTTQGCDSVVEYRVEMMSNQVTSSGLCVGSTLTGSTNAGDVQRMEWLSGNNVVRSVSRSYQTSSVWSQGSHHPAGMYYQESTGVLYVVETGNHRVVRWLPGATSPEVVAGGNGAGSMANQLHNPQDVFVDGQNNVYVTEHGNHRVQRWSPGAAQGVTVAGGNGAGALFSQLSSPYGVWVDGQNRVYVADYGNGRVMRWNPGAVSGSVYRTGDGPIDVCFDASGNFYMAQYSSHNVLRWSTGSNTPVVVAIASHPYQIAVDQRGTVYVSQYHSHLISRHFSGFPSGENLGLQFWCHPYGIAITNSGSLFMNAHHCDHAIRRFDLAPMSMDSLNASLPGTYRVRITRYNGCVTTSNSVQIGSPTVVVNSTHHMEVCPGDTAFLTTVQQPGLNYQWQQNSLNILGATGTQLMVTEPGSYRLKVTDASGCESYSDNLLMRGLPTVQLVSTGGCLTDSMKVVSPDSNIASIEWYKDGSLDKRQEVIYDNGQQLIGGLNQPSGIFIDQLGNTYVADREHDRVIKYLFGSTSPILVAGGNGRGSGLNQLNLPMSVFVDNIGNIYISDYGNHRVVKWLSGSAGGVVVAGGNGQGGGLSQLNSPHGLWVSGAGEIFVVDHGNHRVVKWLVGASMGIVVAGNNIAGSAMNQLNNPTNLFVTQTGEMYIADYANHRIQRWNLGSSSGLTVAGGNGAGIGMNQLNAPWDMCIDGSGTLYVSDHGNHRLMRWRSGFNRGEQVGGLMGYGNGPGQLNHPLGIRIDNLGRIYLTEAGRGRLIMLSPELPSNKGYVPPSSGIYTAKIYTFAGCDLDVSGSVTITNPYLDLQSSYGNLLCVGDTSILSSPYNSGYTYRWYKDNQLIVGANSNDLSVTQSGVYYLEAENVFGCRTISRSYTMLDVPSVSISGNGICSDGQTALSLVTPLDSQMVAMKWVRGSEIIKTQQRQYEPIGDQIGDGGWISCGSSSQWYNQLNISSLFFRNNFVTYSRFGGESWCNQEASVYSRDVETGYTQKIAGFGGVGHLPNQLNNPQGLYVDSQQNLYVADLGNHRIMRYDQGMQSGALVAGGNGQGSDSMSLSYPYDVWVDPLNNVYVVDHSNHRIQRWAPGALFGVTVAGGNGQGGGLNQLNHPTKIVMDAQGWMYIADNHNHRVMRWWPGAASGRVVAGGNGAGGGLNQLYHPHALFIDPSGALYIADNHNHRVMRWLQGANFGEVVLGGQGAGGASVQITHPMGICQAENGNIYVADGGNRRIMRYFHYGIDTAVFRPARGGDYQARVYFRNGCYSESNSVHVGNIDTTRLGTNPNTLASSDFETHTNGWSTSQTHQWNGSTALGPFSNANITFNQGGLWPHDSLEIEFDFFTHDTWDNHEPFQFSLDGQVLGTYYFGNHVSQYPNFEFRGHQNSRCAWAGTRWYRAKFKVPHTASSMEFRINVWDAEDPCNESWSIDNFVVRGAKQVQMICQNQTLQVGTQSLSTQGYHEVMLTNADGCDSLVQVYLVVKPISQTNLTAAICAGQSYTFGNQILTSSGTYVNNLSNSVDCDSVVTLYLTVHQPTMNQVSASVCSPSTYSFGGQMLNQSGTYVHTYASFAGCDSTVSLNLTVLQISQTNLSAAICQGQTYSFGPQTLTSSGQYLQNLTASNGCDSVVTLDLVVRPTYTIPMFQRICSGSSYLFGNQVITATGQYVRHLTSSAGCDSVITLDLVVGTPSPVTILNEVICSPSSFTVGTQSFSTSGQYSVTLSDQSGCDSVVQLNLDVRQPSSHSITATTTGAQFVMVGNQYFNRTGQYTVILTNHRGCDSIITLNLTSIPIQVRASNLTVCNGDTILVPIIVENAMGVSAVSLTLNYPGQNLNYLGYDQVNPSLSTANLLLNATSVNGSQQVRISWYDLIPVNISSGTLLSLRFVVTNPSFNAMEWDLATPGMCEFADEFGDSVPNMIYNNGLIHSGGSFVQWAQTICQGQTYAFDGNSLSASGIYTSIHPDYVGCDSVVVLNLTVNPTSATTLYDTIPIESSYWLGGQVFTHTGVYQVVFQNQFGCDSTVTLHLKVLGYPLSGRLLYNNTAQTPMTNTTVRLKQNGQVVHTSSTNAAGQFAFGPVDSNTYQLEFVHNKPWGGVNATDALGISRHFTNVLPLVGFRLLAGDVNLSNQVNTSDALLVTRRYSNLLSSFPSGNWAYSSTGFHIGPRDNLFLDLKALCYGDVNGSYNPSVTARASWTRMEEDGDQTTNSGVYFLDLKAKRGMDLGAVSLNLRLPEGVQVVSVRSMSKVSDEAVVYKQQGRSLRLAWYHLMPWRLLEGDDVIRLELKGRAEGWLEMDETESELANSDGVALTGWPLTAARLRLQTSKVPMEASIFPNPASNRSSLNLILGRPSTLRVEVVDAIGRRVHQSHDPMLSAGEHRLELPMDEWSDGQYYVLVQALTEDGQVLKQSLKLQKKR